MLYGHVRDRLPRLLLSLPGQSGEYSVEFIIDTGFDGDLTLPPDFVRHLEVHDLLPVRIRLADGTEQDCLEGTIFLDWNGEQRTTQVLILGNSPLLGMALLDGCQVCFHVSDGGEVTVEEA